MSALRRALLASLLLLAFPASASAIVGGSVATQPYPFMAAMESFEDGEWSFRCGGSLVKPDVVLTAAHCVDATDGGTMPATTFRFQVGTAKRSAGGERIGVTEVREHPRYDETGTYDVALMKLERPVSSGATIRLAQPGEESLWQPGDVATVIGWGAQLSGGGASDDLRQVGVPIRSDAECATFNFSLQPATEICAGERTGGRDSCQGDSGGPQMVQSSGAWVQVGVVSYGLGCAFPTQYGVYSEAAGGELRGYIEQNANAMTSGQAIGSVAPPAGGGTAPGTSAPSGSPAALPAIPLRLRLPSSLGSARKARRRGRIRVLVRTNRPLRSLRVTLKRGKRVYASGRRAKLVSKRGRVTLKIRRRGLRAGRATLRISARDASGKRVTQTRRVRLRR